MKDVFFVYRKSGLNYSIEHVFNTVESGLRKENVLVKNIFLPYARVCVSNLLRNILYVKRLWHYSFDGRYALCDPFM